MWTVALIFLKNTLKLLAKQAGKIILTAVLSELFVKQLIIDALEALKKRVKWAWLLKIVNALLKALGAPSEQ